MLPSVPRLFLRHACWLDLSKVNGANCQSHRKPHWSLLVSGWAPVATQINVAHSVVILLLVAMGYAEVYRGAPCQVYCRELEDAEAKARRDQVGMWAQGVMYESLAPFRVSEEAS